MIKYIKISIIRNVITICVFAGLCCVSCQRKGATFTDDNCRYLSVEQDSILEKMIVDCKNECMKHYREQWDTSHFYVTFDFFTSNDTDKVWVMGDYEVPLVFHDKKINSEKFIGYFTKGISHCFIYNNLFVLPEGGKSNQFSSQISNTLQFLDPSQTPNLLPEDLDERTIDPYMFEYAIIAHQCILLRKGHW